MKFCKGPRGERNGKALSEADFSLRSSQSVNSHKITKQEDVNEVDVFFFLYLDANLFAEEGAYWSK